MEKEEIRKRMMSVGERLQAATDLIDRGEYGGAFLLTNGAASDVVKLNCEIKATAEEKLREELREKAKLTVKRRELVSMDKVVDYVMGKERRSI